MFYLEGDRNSTFNVSYLVLSRVRAQDDDVDEPGSPSTDHGPRTLHPGPRSLRGSRGGFDPGHSGSSGTQYVKVSRCKGRSES